MTIIDFYKKLSKILTDTREEFLSRAEGESKLEKLLEESETHGLQIKIKRQRLLFLFVSIPGLRLTIHPSTTHGAIYIGPAGPRIKFFILVGMSSPTSPTKHVFARIQQYRTFIFCAISIRAIFYPRRSALRPIIR